MSEASLSPKRPRLDYDENSGKEDHYDKYNKSRDREDEQSSFSQSKHRKRSDPEENDEKDEDGKTKVSNVETARREHTLVMRLTSKEQELQDCMGQIQEMKQAQTQNTAQLRSMLLDPAINLVFQRMAKEMDEHKEKLKQKQNELSAWKFTPDSQTGMRLMAKCRLLLQENGDLGKMISSGRTARLEGEIALHKALVTEMKKNQKELDEFVGELEEDVEGMQGMIFMLQQQLKEAREQIARLQQENEQLRTLGMTPDPEPGGNLDCNSSSNTPLHNWPSETGTDTEAEPVASIPSSTIHPGDRGNGAVSYLTVTTERTSLIPPVVSALSDPHKTSVVSSDSLTVSQSVEDFNPSSFAFKVTPDSGMQTQEEEDTSMDTTEFAASAGLEQPCDPNQFISNKEPATRTLAEHDGSNGPNSEIITPLAGLAQKCNSLNNVGDTSLRTTSTTLVSDRTDHTSPTRHPQNSSNDLDQKIETNAVVNVQNAALNERTQQLTETLPVDGSINRSNQSKKEDSPVATYKDDETVKENNQDENKSSLPARLDLNTMKTEEDKSDCQAKVGLVNGSSNIPGQGL